MPLPFKGPDNTLFQLMGFVVEAGRRFATITDLKVGDGNQQAAVGTTIAMLEQGSRVMSAVHKRLHYAMRQEFKILSRVMAESLPPSYPYEIEGTSSEIFAKDFDDRIDVIPVSNPNVFSQAQRIALAQTKMQLAVQAPELHNMYEVYRDMYEALGVRDIDKVLKAQSEKKPEPKDPAQENIDALEKSPMVAFPGQDHQAHILAHLVFGASPMVGAMADVAMAVQKQIMSHVQIQAREMAAQQLQFDGEGTPEQKMQFEALTAQMVGQLMQEVQQLSRSISGGQQGADPVVALKEQELQIRAQAEQNDAEIDRQKLQLQQGAQQEKARQFNERIASQERQTQARIDASLRREQMKGTQ